jgi:hypothetical protein
MLDLPTTLLSSTERNQLRLVAQEQQNPDYYADKPEEYMENAGTRAAENGNQEPRFWVVHEPFQFNSSRCNREYADGYKAETNYCRRIFHVSALSSDKRENNTKFSSSSNPLILMPLLPSKFRLTSRMQSTALVAVKVTFRSLNDDDPHRGHSLVADGYGVDGSKVASFQ